MAPRLLSYPVVPQPIPLPIGIAITRFNPGGTERQMIELIRRLDRSRWQVHVACTAAEGAWLGRVVDSAASVTSFPVSGFARPATFAQTRAFARWCRAHRLAIVHASDLYMNIFALPAAALARVPVRIGNRREINPGKSFAHLALQRVAYSCAHRIVANARAGADRLRREGVPAGRITVVPNGIDLQMYEPRPARTARRRVVIVANLRPEKGHEVLIDAAADVVRVVPAHFDVVGDGLLRDALISRVAARGLSSFFTFHGHCDDVPARLKESDIFVLPSRSEAFPNAILEAMAVGLPVIASNVGGIGEVVSHERTGLLVPAGDAAALAAALRRLLTEPALANRLAAAGREEVASRYSFERMVATFESVYLAELTRRGVSPATQPSLATF